ncbi:MAG TPA: methyl-accepting chemotaxis protein [Polyangiaceae bacterium]|nr:methyl-accepting chemotaxis protein [Polyangiaceae bacterium]
MRIPVGTKLGLAFLTIAALTVAMALLAFERSGHTRTALEEMHQNGVLGTQALGRIASDVQRIRGRTFLHAVAPTATEKSEVEREIAQLERDVETWLRQAEDSYGHTPAQRAQVQQIRELHQRYVQLRNREVLPLSRNGQIEEAMRAAVRHSGPVFRELSETTRGAIATNVKENEALHQRVAASLDQAQRISFWGSVLVVGVALLASLLLTRSISRRVVHLSTVANAVQRGDRAQRAREEGNDEVADLAAAFNAMTDELESRAERERRSAAEQQTERERLARAVSAYGKFVDRVARGDLTATLEQQNEGDMATLGENLSAMGAALRTMSLRIHEAVGSLSSATAQIMTTTQEHSANATESASAVAETVATVDQVAQNARQTAELAKDVAEASQRSLDVCTVGRKSVDRTVAEMENVRGQVSSIADRILVLSEQAQAVGQIITTVNELAEQSNLLALNAAIEAARAGEQGRGFAVVAQEIRALAEQSKRATAQVRTILGDIQKSTSAAVLVTEQGNKAVKAAVDAVSEAGAQLEELASATATSAEAAGQIELAAQQQAEGVSHISQAMHAIRQATAQTVEGTRQTERAARDLNDLSVRLRDAVSQYRA